MYDLIIIGAGPAGFTASIFSTRREMKTLIISKDIGGQIIWANEIENYPGFNKINNFDFINKLKDQSISFGAMLIEDKIMKIEKKEDSTFIVYTENEVYKSKSLILALGLVPKNLNIPGEKEFNGKGISYCANCDGPFFRNKVVSVIGAGNSAFDAAEVMSKIAKEVYLISRSDNFKAFDSLVAQVKSRSNIKIITNADTQEIKGENKVEELIYKDNKTGESKTIKTDGVFIEIGRKANTELVKEFVDLDEYGQIIVDKNQMTKTVGLFAAGDVVSGEYKQIPIASGQATVAALAAYKYLQSNN